MPGLVPGIHVCCSASKTWMAGASPAMTGLGIDELEASVERNRMARERRARVSAIVYPVGVVLGVLALWEAATRMLGVPAFLLPPPSAVAISLMANASLLLFHGWITTIEVVLGFALSIAVGIPLALAIFLWPVSRAPSCRSWSRRRPCPRWPSHRSCWSGSDSGCCRKS